MIFEAINGGLIAGGDRTDVVDGGSITDFDRVVVVVVVDGVPVTADDVPMYVDDTSSSDDSTDAGNADDTDGASTKKPIRLN